jgi:hypothetical protein
MARALAELESEIRALSKADREKLLDFLMLDTESPPKEVRELVRQFGEKVELTSKSLDSTIAFLAGLDDRLEQGRIKAREEVLQSGERWPFVEPPSLDPH